MEPDLVSIILPSYNRVDTISRAIESVSNQTYKNYELIVVDDGSTDNTEEVIGSLRIPKLTYIKHTCNKGAAAARNTGLEVAKGEYLAFQDSDDEWHPDKLEKQIAIMKSHKTTDVVYSDVLRVNSSGTIEYFKAPTIIDSEIVSCKTKDYSPVGIALPSVIFRRYLFFDGKELFDEKLPCFIDLELFIRLLLKGYHFYHLKEPLGKYYLTKDSISNSISKVPYARKLILDKVWSKVKNNNTFVAVEFYRIGTALCKNNNVEEGRRFLFDAWVKRVWNLKYLIALVSTVFGSKVFFAIIGLKRLSHKKSWKTGGDDSITPRTEGGS